MRTVLGLFVALVAALSISVTALAANAQLQSFGTGDVVVAGDTATITNESGEYGGVYLNSKSWSGKLADVSMSFVSSGDVAGGAPRFSIPIDSDGNAAADGYAFIDVNSCGGSTTVGTTEENCGVYYLDGFYANWAAFVAANPSYRLAPGAIPFIISDQPGTYTLSNIQLR